MSQMPLTWRRHTVAALGLVLDAFDGPPAAEGSEAGITYFVQTSGPAQLAIRAGAGQDLAGWRKTYGPPRQAAFGDEAGTTLCGQPAKRQEVTVEPTQAIGGFIGPDGKSVTMEHNDPRMVYVAVASRIGDQPFVAVWSVDSTQRGVPCRRGALLRVDPLPALITALVLSRAFERPSLPEGLPPRRHRRPRGCPLPRDSARRPLRQ